MKRQTLPFYLLLCAAGVAVGAAIMKFADTGVVNWSRIISAALLLVSAVGYAKYGNQRVR